MTEHHGNTDPPCYQVVDQRVLSTRYHLRWRPWLGRAPRLRLITMTSEEYDSLTPLPVIPNLRQVRSVDLTPSAPEQRRDRQTDDSKLNRSGYSLRNSKTFIN